MSITIDGDLNTISQDTASISVNHAFILPSGNILQRPALPIAGMIRYNTTTNRVEGYNGVEWGNLL